MDKFSNNETTVQLGEPVRNQDIFIIQTGILSSFFHPDKRTDNVIKFTFVSKEAMPSSFVIILIIISRIAMSSKLLLKVG